MSLVVEDGSGLATAESYASVAAADAYWADRSEPTAWAGADTAAKEVALREATEYLDGRYGSRWKGCRANPTVQALDWPRSSVLDRDGYYVASDELPTNLVRAAIEAAGRQVSADLAPDVDSDDVGIAATTVKAGSVSESVEYAGTKAVSDRLVKVERLLAPLMRPPGEIVRG